MKKLFTICCGLSILFLFLTFFQCQKVRIRGAQANGDEWPEFPWPPPKASASHNIPNNLLLAQAITYTLGDIDEMLIEALLSAGYTDKSYYSVPDGFAIVTKLEQINQDGTPKPVPDRYSQEVRPLTKFNLRGYISALFSARRGLYRIIVFIVTSHPFSQEDITISRDQAEVWLSSGLNRLPSKIAEIIYTNDYMCTALIYEFEQITPQQEATLKDPSMLTVKQHLDKAGIWEKLGD